MASCDRNHKASKKATSKEALPSAKSAWKEANSHGNHPLEKRKFCIYHLQGVCKYSANDCPFAHSIEEIQLARNRKRTARAGGPPALNSSKAATNDEARTRSSSPAEEAQFKQFLPDEFPADAGMNDWSRNDPMPAAPAAVAQGRKLHEPMFVEPLSYAAAGGKTGLPNMPGAVGPGVASAESIGAQVQLLLDSMERNLISGKAAVQGSPSHGRLLKEDLIELSRSIHNLSQALSCLNLQADQMNYQMWASLLGDFGAAGAIMPSLQGLSPFVPAAPVMPLMPAMATCATPAMSVGTRQFPLGSVPGGMTSANFGLEAALLRSLVQKHDLRVSQ
eukprot:gb/GFBE01010033.1/.p1 GENE.gb/GFBE01010033.1/~~gb/GFBE01010033.1/.p1  ORF type:complete len:334 (+),score=48.18 gb/GFBE01010033.1/:1-1002(+)